MRRIGILQFVPALAPVVEGFRRGLDEKGLREGQDLALVHRSVEGQADRLPGALDDLLQAEVDLILAVATPAAKAAAARQACPVVFAPVFDPVGARLVERTERPGRPVTGVSGMIPGRRKLDLLRRLFPGLSEVTVLFNPQDPNAPAEAADLAKAGSAEGIAVRVARVRDPQELAELLPQVMAEAQVVLLSVDRLTGAELERIAAAATAAKRPLVAHDGSGVRRGALLALEADPVSMGRRAADLAFRILNGEDPAGLPVEYATDARLSVNARVAEALGYAVPKEIRPDEVVTAESGA